MKNKLLFNKKQTIFFASLGVVFMLFIIGVIFTIFNIEKIKENKEGNPSMNTEKQATVDVSTLNEAASTVAESMILDNSLEITNMLIQAGILDNSSKYTASDYLNNESLIQTLEEKGYLLKDFDFKDITPGAILLNEHYMVYVSKVVWDCYTIYDFHLYDGKSVDFYTDPLKEYNFTKMYIFKDSEISKGELDNLVPTTPDTEKD